jgi:hypothetical protein
MAAEPPWSSSKPTRRREMPSMWSPDADTKPLSLECLVMWSAGASLERIAL